MESEENTKKIANAIKGAQSYSKKEKGFMPDKCPVVCLGTKNGIFYYIDAILQLRELKDKDHGSKQIMALFGANSDYLYKGRYARQNDKGDITGWRTDDVARDLMATCSMNGIWDPAKKVRGPGAWLDENDKIVLHGGSQIYKDNQTIRPGVIGSFVYPNDDERQRPSDNPAGNDAVAPLLELIKTWNWDRPELDPYLLIGWIAAAMIGGALKWRPLLWVTGDKGTGKSTLQDVVSAVFNGALLSVSDPTPAGIWQRTQYSSLPVAIDEIEPEEDSRKVQAVIKLARQACSGGVVLRGSSEGKASEFTARNCYFFSSILIPPLTPQDRSRMAILELGEIGGKPPHIDKRSLSTIGSLILRRMIDNYEIYLENIEMMRIALSKLKLDSRGCDQFGSLIAAADVLTRNGPMTTDDVNEWAELLSSVIAQEKYENVADNVACAEFLFTSMCDFYKDGKKRTIGDWIAEAAGVSCSRDSEDCQPKDANKVLSTFGLRVDTVEINKNSAIKVLFIAQNHQSLAKVFVATRWQGGVWTQAFRRFKGASSYGTRRFNGVASKCVYVPIEELPLFMSNEDALNLMQC